MRMESTKWTWKREINGNRKIMEWEKKNEDTAKYIQDVSRNLACSPGREDPHQQPCSQLRGWQGHPRPPQVPNTLAPSVCRTFHCLWRVNKYEGGKWREKTRERLRPPERSTTYLHWRRADFQTTAWGWLRAQTFPVKRYQMELVWGKVRCSKPLIRDVSANEYHFLSFPFFTSFCSPLSRHQREKNVYGCGRGTGHSCWELQWYQDRANSHGH